MDITNRDAFAIREFCARYGICRDTFYAEVRRGRLRALKLGKKTIVLKADAEGWAKSLPALELAPGDMSRNSSSTHLVRCPAKEMPGRVDARRRQKEIPNDFLQRAPEGVN
jgi:hypothetical protein